MGLGNTRHAYSCVACSVQARPPAILPGPSSLINSKAACSTKICQPILHALHGKQLSPSLEGLVYAGLEGEAHLRLSIGPTVLGALNAVQVLLPEGLQRLALVQRALPAIIPLLVGGL